MTNQESPPIHHIRESKSESAGAEGDMPGWVLPETVEAVFDAAGLTHALGNTAIPAGTDGEPVPVGSLIKGVEIVYRDASLAGAIPEPGGDAVKTPPPDPETTPVPAEQIKLFLGSGPLAQHIQEANQQLDRRDGNPAASRLGAVPASRVSSFGVSRAHQPVGRSARRGKIKRF